MMSGSRPALLALALQNELYSALTYATNNKFQIHPDAFAMLKGLEDDILKIVQEIVRTKKNSKNSVILVEDIKVVLNPAKALVENAPTEQLYTIMMDPTPKVTTGEGVEGYSALFRSRFEKTMRILSQRPDSKRISKVAAVKQNARNGSRTQ